MFWLVNLCASIVTGCSGAPLIYDGIWRIFGRLSEYFLFWLVDPCAPIVIGCSEAAPIYIGWGQRICLLPPPDSISGSGKACSQLQFQLLLSLEAFLDTSVLSRRKEKRDRKLSIRHYCQTVVQSEKRDRKLFIKLLGSFTE